MSGSYTPNVPNHINVPLTFNAQFSNGTYLPTDQILSISVQSNSAATIGTYSSIISSLNVVQLPGIVSYKLNNVDIAQLADEQAAITLTASVNALYEYLFNTTLAVPPTK